MLPPALPQNRGSRHWCIGAICGRRGGNTPAPNSQIFPGGYLVWPGSWIEVQDCPGAQVRVVALGPGCFEDFESPMEWFTWLMTRCRSSPPHSLHTISTSWLELVTRIS